MILDIRKSLKVEIMAIMVFYYFYLSYAGLGHIHCCLRSYKVGKIFQAYIK